MGSVMLCKLPGNFREGDKGTKAISGSHTQNRAGMEGNLLRT